MSFVSLEFFGFLALLFLVYFITPGKHQWKVIPVFSMIFYLSCGVESILFILFTIIVTYYVGFFLNKEEDKFKEFKNQCEDREQRKVYKDNYNRNKKRIMVAGLVSVFGVWIVLKYTDLFSISPVGISIYTFIAAGYCIDVYREKFAAEKSFGKYFTFVTFFPQIIQGPFSRYDVLSPTLFEKHVFDFERFGRGVARICYGYFKKLVIANRLTVAVDAIMAVDSGYGGIYVFMLFLILPIRLYADFSGYMDIVVGVCHILGIDLQENFRQPIFAKSIDEFWRRWHITLGAWFKDYLFYAVSMGKTAQKIAKKCKKKLSPATARMIPSYIAFVLVWSATGLWHGGKPTYLIWGWINLICIVSSMQLKPFYTKVKAKLHIKDESKAWKCFQMMRTFLIFGFAEMVSDTRSVYRMIMNCKSLFCEHNWNLLLTPLELFPGLEVMDLIILAISVFFMYLVDVLKEKEIDINVMTHKSPVWVRYIGYAVLFYFILVFGYVGADAAEGFMYAQF